MAVTGTEELDTIDEFQEGVLKNVQLAGLITPLNWNVDITEHQCDAIGIASYGLNVLNELLE